MPKSTDTSISVLPDGTSIAAELDIQAAPTLAGVGTRPFSLNFIDVTNNGIVAQVTAGRSSPAGSVAQLSVYSETTPTTVSAGIQVIAKDAGNDSEVLVNANANDLLLIDGQGNSNFLQNPLAGSHFLSSGFVVGASGAWPAAGVIGISITHGLGKLPTAIAANITDGGSLAAGAIWVNGVFSKTTTTALVILYNGTGTPLNGTVGIMWMATG